VTPSSSDVEVPAGAESDVTLLFDKKTAPGEYPVAVTVTTDDGAVVAQANAMATVDEQPDDSAAGLGCSAAGGMGGMGGAGFGVLLGLGVVTLRRRRGDS
jgi:uncharacterized protein (TIGR03382 family)